MTEAEEDEPARNRRLAMSFLHRTHDAAKRWFPEIAATIQAASDDLARGRRKSADTKLARASSEASRIARAPRTDPQKVTVALEISDATDRARESLRGYGHVINAEFREVD